MIFDNYFDKWYYTPYLSLFKLFKQIKATS